MNIRAGMGVVACVLLLGSPSWSQSPQDLMSLVRNKPFRVIVYVSSDSSKDEILSFVSRELRELGDVIIVDEEQDYKLHIVHVKAGGVDALSAVSLGEVWSGLRLLSRVAPEAKIDTFGIYRCLEQDAGYLAMDILVTGTDLKERCETIVASFDSQCLAPIRAFRQKTRDSIEKLIPERK